MAKLSCVGSPPWFSGLSSSFDPASLNPVTRLLDPRTFPLHGLLTNDGSGADVQATAANCCDFDGATSSVDVTGLATVRSVSAQFATGVALPAVIGRIWAWRTNEHSVYVFNDGRITAIYNGTIVHAAAAGTISTSTDYHVALTHDGTTARFYLDGTELGSNAIAVDDTSGDLEIGDGAGQRWLGQIWDVDAFSDQLTTDELTWKQTSGKSGTDPGNANRIGWWPLQHSGAAYDVSGNGNHGTLVTISGATQDLFFYNSAMGYSLYEHASSPDIWVPYGVDGSPLSITPPAGYSKTVDVPGGKHSGEALVQGDAFDATLTNPEFQRERTISGTHRGSDRRLVYGSPLSGAELANVQSYTASTPY